MQRRGPKGMLQPREAIRTTAYYDGDAGRWESIGNRTTVTSDELPSRRARGQSVDDDAPMIAIPLDDHRDVMDSIDAFEDQEDVFGHGGGLDEADDMVIDEAPVHDGKDGVNEGTQQEVGSAEAARGEAERPNGARCGRRGASSFHGYLENASTQAAVRRMMMDTRPATRDGAARLSELKRRVRQRLANGPAAEVKGPPSDGSEVEERQGTMERKSSGSRNWEPSIRSVTGPRGSSDDNGADMDADASGSRRYEVSCTINGCVLASNVGTNYVGITREGPGDPSLACVAETVTRLTAAASVADSVAGGDVAATLSTWAQARGTQGTRGEAACGPPPRFCCTVGGHEGHDW